MLVVQPSVAQPHFQAPFVTYPVHGEAELAEAADLDGDGRQDLIVVSDTFSGLDALTVLFGVDGGEFVTHDVELLAEAPHSMDLVDVDQDGDLDVVTVQYAENLIRVFEQTSMGDFEPSVSLPTIVSPSGILAGDVNSDGLLDLVVRPYWSTTLALHLGAAGGGFLPMSTFAFEAYYAYEMQIADMNVDGKPDLVFVRQGAVAVWPGDGLGGFGPAYYAPAAGNDFAIEDFNHDSRPDVAIVTGNTLVIALGRPTGDFQVVAEYPTAQYHESIAVVSCDLNDDGRTDLVVSNRQSFRLLTFEGRGDGSFTPTANVSCPAPVAALVMDVDADKNNDVVLASGDVCVLHGDGAGAFRRAISITCGISGDRQFGHAVGDLDGDRKLDVVTANSQSHSVSVLEGMGDGTFRLKDTLTFEQSPYSIALADLDADGRLDLMVGFSDYSRAEGTIAVQLGHGDGSFDPSVETAVGPFPSSMRVADLNADGHLDLALAITRDDDGTGGLTVLLGAGDGSFFARHDVAGIGFQDIEVADFDADGDLDLVLTGAYSVLRQYVGNGQGQFTLGPGLSLPGYGWSLGTGDLNGDGHVDAVVGWGVYASTSGVEILLGNGSGILQRVATVDVHEPLSVAVADLNRDGALDIAAGSLSSGPSTVSVFSGRGDGTFENPIGYGVGWAAKKITAVDIDRSGTLDLLVSNLYTHDLHVLLADRTVPVNLSNLTAASQSGGVALAWEVAAGTWFEILGVHVARSAAEAGPFERLTAAPLGAQRFMAFEDHNPPAGGTWYRIEALMQDGSVLIAGPVQVDVTGGLLTGLIGISVDSHRIRVRYGLGRRSPMTLAVYDVRGRIVQQLVNGVQNAGVHTTDWDGRTVTGSPLPRGVYLVRLVAAEQSHSRKVALTRPR